MPRVAALERGLPILVVVLLAGLIALGPVQAAGAPVAAGAATGGGEAGPTAVQRLQIALRGLQTCTARVRLQLCGEECVTHVADIATNSTRFTARFVEGPYVNQVHEWQDGVVWASAPGTTSRLLSVPIDNLLSLTHMIWPDVPADATLSPDTFNGRAGTAATWTKDDEKHQVVIDNATGLPLLYTTQTGDDEEVVLRWSRVDASGHHVLTGLPETAGAVLIEVRPEKDTWVLVAVRRPQLTMEYSDVALDTADKVRVVPEIQTYVSLRAEGFRYTQADRYDQAVVPFSKALALAPYLAEAHMYLANAYLFSGQRHQAMVEYEQTLMLDPYQPGVYNNLAYTLAEDGLELDKALRYAEIAVYLDEDNSSFLDTLGFVLVLAGEWKKGEERLWDAINLLGETCEDADCRSSMATSLSHIALARHRQGDTATARELMLEARRWDAKVYIPLNLRREFRVIEGQ